MRSNLALAGMIVVSMAVMPSAVDGQTVGLSVSALVGTHQIGAEVAAEVHRFGIFGRIEGLPASLTTSQTLGGRYTLAPTSVSPVFAVVAVRTKCDETDSSGGASGCDGQSHVSPGVSGGLQIPLRSTAIWVFADGTYLFSDEDDVPAWTFVGGIRLRF